MEPRKNLLEKLETVQKEVLNRMVLSYLTADKKKSEEKKNNADTDPLNALRLTSKACYALVKKFEKTIKVGDLTFNKNLFLRLTKQRPFPQYDCDGYPLDEIKISFVQVNLDKNGIVRGTFDSKLQDHPQLICQMMEDKGFKALVERANPAELADRRLFLGRKITRGILGGVTGLIVSALAICVVMPVYAFSMALSLLFFGIPLGAGGWSLRPSFFGLGPLFTPPFVMVYSAFKGAQLSYRSHSTTPFKAIISNIIRASFLMMWRTTFPEFCPYSCGETVINPWYSLEEQYNSRTYQEIALDWREKHKLPTIALSSGAKSSGKLERPNVTFASSNTKIGKQLPIRSAPEQQVEKLGFVSGSTPQPSIHPTIIESPSLAEVVFSQPTLKLS